MRPSLRHLRLPSLLLLACAGGSSDPRPPGAPAALVANSGHGAFSVGWDPPAEGGAAEDYVVTVEPALARSGSTAHRTALYTGAVDGTRYTVSVVARNAAGVGPPRTIEVTPRAYSSAGEAALVVQGDDSPSGIYDPSVVISGATAWMSYSSVDYHLDGEGHRVEDVGIRIARSDDGGRTWTHARTVATPEPATVADPSGIACGTATCVGRWVYETSWLVEQPAAPAAARFQLFAHQYFLYPPDATVEGRSAVKYHLGRIAAWEAASPEQLGAAAPRTALRWNLTPSSFTDGQNVNALPELAGCVVVAEGSASVRGGTMDLVLACPYESGTPLPQKIVLLRSTDRGRSFSYVSTLLDAPDAAWLGADHFTAPALLAGPDAAPVLIVTPSLSGIYGGCAVVPFSDPVAGTLFRVDGLPAVIRFEELAVGTMGGACAAARGLTGVLRSQASGLGAWPPVFGIRTGAPL